MRLNNVVFCGENPGLDLLNAAGETTAAASYWFCTYSPYGEGHVLLIRFDAATAAALGQPPAAIYSDNPALGRYLADTFTQYFGAWSGAGVPALPVLPARLFKESDSRSYYRAVCQAEGALIELLWADVKEISMRVIPDSPLGEATYHIFTVFFLCERATITVNGRAAEGAPVVKTNAEGKLSSSAFVALAETWVRL
jgi:hypothetical protein